MKIKLWKKGRFGRQYTVSSDLECCTDARDALVKVGEVEGVLLRVDEDGTAVNLAIISQEGYEKAQRAMIVPLATSHLRIQCDKDTLSLLKAHLSKRNAPQEQYVPTTSPVPTSPALPPEGDVGPPPTLESLEARYKALNKPRKPNIDNLKDRFLALRDGDSTGPVFNNYAAQYNYNNDECEDDIVGWAQSMVVQQPDEDFEKIIMEAANWKADEDCDGLDRRMETAAIVEEARNLVRDAHTLAAQEEEKESRRDSDDDDEASSSSSSSEDEDDSSST